MDTPHTYILCIYIFICNKDLVYSKSIFVSYTSDIWPHGQIYPTYWTSDSIQLIDNQLSRVGEYTALKNVLTPVEWSKQIFLNRFLCMYLGQNWILIHLSFKFDAYLWTDWLASLSKYRNKMFEESQNGMLRTKDCNVLDEKHQSGCDHT